jgi:hypothetical protein
MDGAAKHSKSFSNLLNNPAANMKVYFYLAKFKQKSIKCNIKVESEQFTNKGVKLNTKNYSGYEYDRFERAGVLTAYL